jgi:predicted ATP-grasp superfamily ATP-dependent carboligase
MQSLSSVLTKSKKNAVFHQAYTLTKFKEALEALKQKNYLDLKVEFDGLQIFIIETNKKFIIKLKTNCNSFKTFLKTELENINLEIHSFFVQKGLSQIEFEVLIV